MAEWDRWLKTFSTLALLDHVDYFAK